MADEQPKERATEEQLATQVEVALQQVFLGGIYVHYKHPERQYMVVSVGIDEPSEKPMVSYKALYGRQLLWHKLLSDWLKPTDTGVERYQRVE